jgi:hypothetical protein
MQTAVIAALAVWLAKIVVKKSLSFRSASRALR